MKASKSNVSTIAVARPGSKREAALKIFTDVTSDNHRQDTLARLQSELKMQPTTASTYYNFCVAALEKQQEAKTKQAIESTAARKYSAVKFERGSDGVAARVAVFLKKSEAEQFNQQLHYNTVIPGVAQVGKKVG